MELLRLQVDSWGFGVQETLRDEAVGACWPFARVTSVTADSEFRGCFCRVVKKVL